MMTEPPSGESIPPPGGYGGRYSFRLYIAGATPMSSHATVNLRKICELHLKGRYEIEVIDLLDNPSRASEDQILAAPTLIRRRPLPERRLIGDLSLTARVLEVIQ